MKISIKLENYTYASYFPGSTIHGFVLLDVGSISHSNFSNGIKSNGLTIKCVGEATVESRNERDRSITYVADREVYLNDEKSLIGSQQDGSELTIPPGIHEFPFQFTLPRNKNIPSSFFSLYGRVQYYLQATLHRSWKLNAETRLNFCVNGIVDLNTAPSPLENIPCLSQSVTLKKEDNASFLCFNTKPIRFELKLPRLGFVIGESIPFDLFVSNLSSSRITTCSVSFYQGVICTMSSGLNTNYDKNLLRKFRFGEVAGGDEKNWTDYSFKLPALPPTGLGGVCRLINIKYWIEVHVSSFISSAFGTLPFIVGNIPFDTIRNVHSERHSDEQQLPTTTESTIDTQRSTARTGSILDDYPNLTLPSYEDVADEQCPSYEEAQAISEEQQHVFMQNGNFRPKYAVFQTTTTTKEK